jgi:hypothetical protein
MASRALIMCRFLFLACWSFGENGVLHGCRRLIPRILGLQIPPFLSFWAQGALSHYSDYSGAIRKAQYTEGMWVSPSFFFFFFFFKCFLDGFVLGGLGHGY